MNPPINPVLVKDGAGLLRTAAFLRTLTEFGFDTETNIVPKFWDRRIRTIQVGNKDEQHVIDLLEFAGSERLLVGFQGYRGAWIKGSPLEVVYTTLRPFLESRGWLKLGVNLGFDYLVSKWCLGLRPWHLYDCMMAEKVRWTGQVGFYERDYWGMKDMAARYCGLLIDKSQQKTFDLCTPLTQEQIEYAALDVRLPSAVKQGQDKPIAADGLAWAVQIENDAIPAFGDLHLNGMNISSAMWLGLVAEVQKDHQRLLGTLDTHLLPIVGMKGATPQMDASLGLLEATWKAEPERALRAAHRAVHLAARQKIAALRKKEPDCEGCANINYGSSDQVLAALQTIKRFKTLTSTADVELEEYEGDPLIDALREFRSAEKIISSYGVKWIETNVDPMDGRVHAVFQSLGAETGRTACEKPNLQNILKGKDWRGCFIAPPGKKIVTCDWSGQELRILTDYSGEESWRIAFENDWDVHSMCADDLEGEKWARGALPDCAYFHNNDKRKCKCPAHDEHRNGFKPVNFGIPYGKTEYALRRDLKVSLAVAREKLLAWYKKYPKHCAWLTEAASDAKLKGESRTRSGRRRLFPKLVYEQLAFTLSKQLRRPATSDEVMKALRSKQNGTEREGKNTPIQGTGSEMLKIAIGCGFDPEGKPFLWHTLEPEYDALLVNEVHDEIVSEAHEHNAKAVKNLMLDAMLRAGRMLVKTIAMTGEGKVGDKWLK
jgi:DNA polymerase-1